jgi:hypothetical protein
MDWEIAGDSGVLRWIGQKFGRAAITDFVSDSHAMIERMSFEVQTFWPAAIEQWSSVQMLGDSFAVSEAAHG